MDLILAEARTFEKIETLIKLCHTPAPVELNNITVDKL